VKQSAVLYNPQQGYSVLLSLWSVIKPALFAGHRLVVKVEPERRSLAENAKLHAMLAEIADQKEWAGKKRDTETWKRLMVAAWCRAKGEAVEFLPAIDGMGVDIVFRRTSELDKSECADLISFIDAWGSDNGVEFSQ
jgi:hypothetical protein